MGNSPAATITLTPATQALDIQVVAGKSYVFTADAGQVAVYERKPNFSIKPESNIPKGEHLVLVKTLDLPTIFNPLYGPDDPAHPRPHNVNALLARVWNWRPQNPNDPRYGPIPCFVEDPFDWRGALFAGNNLYKSGPDGQPASPPQLWTDQNPVQIGGQPHSRYLPTTSCICSLYDARIAYDEVHDVYLIGTAARNHLWNNLPGYPDASATTNPDETHHPAVAAQARRYLFLAVSRPGADPTLETSYDAVPANDENADWPLLGVHGDNILVTHASGGAIFYGPGMLAKGGIFGQHSGAWDGETMGSDAILPVREHTPVEPNGRALVFFIGASRTDNTRLVVNAAFEGAPDGLIKGSATVSLGFKGLDPTNTDAVYHDGFIHVFTSGADSALRYFAVKTELVGDTSLTVQSPVSPPLTIQDPDDPKTVRLDSPGIEVTKNGDVVLSYRAAGARKNGPQVFLETRYQVLYHNESAFRDYAVLKAADPGSTVANLERIDFAKGWLDPDGLTVWFAGSYASGANQKAVIGAVKP
jgi:hypothetical protein